jgi:putative transcriptional regulator
MIDEDTKLVPTGHDWSRADAMTDDEVRAAALQDPEGQPLTQARLAGMRPVPRISSMRRALGLAQEAFAARDCIPLGPLLDWEPGRAEPDQTARAYLAVITRDPEAPRVPSKPDSLAE